MEWTSAPITQEGLRGYDWRASLEVPETGRRIGFASLEQLFAYLMDVSESLPINSDRNPI
jgi:hypothetical protein